MATHACPGCLRVTSREGRCLACGGGTTTQRGYGASWRLRRARQLLRHPLCQRVVTLPSTTCQLRATDVDHIVPKVHRGTDDASNLQSLCRLHHRLKTARDDPAHGLLIAINRRGRQRRDTQARLAPQSPMSTTRDVPMAAFVTHSVRRAPGTML